MCCLFFFISVSRTDPHTPTEALLTAYYAVTVGHQISLYLKGNSPVSHQPQHVPNKANKLHVGWPGAVVMACIICHFGWEMRSRDVLAILSQAVVVDHLLIIPAIKPQRGTVPCMDGPVQLYAQ